MSPGRLWLAALSGAMAAFLGFHHPALAWVSAVPALAAVRGATVPAAALCGALGAGLCAAICAWGVRVGGAWLYGVVVAGMAGFMALAAAALAWLGRGREGRWSWVFLPSIVWGALTWVVPLLDLPVPSSIASSQWAVPAILQIAALTGPVGVTFLFWVGNASIAQGICWLRMARPACPPDPHDASRRGQAVPRSEWWSLLTASGLCLGGALAFGLLRLSLSPAAGSSKPLRAAIVQGAVPIQAYWHSATNPAGQRFLNDLYLRLTRRAGELSPDLILWPEQPVLGDFLERDQLDPKISFLARELGIHLLIGASTPYAGDRPTRPAPSPFQFNSALFVSSEGDLLGRYDKRRLTPLEPYQPGKRPPVMESPWGKVGLFICEESLYPSFRREVVRRGATVLVEMSNDAALGPSRAALLHGREAILTAVAFHRPYLRAGQSGPSYAVDPLGRVVSGSRLFEETVVVGRVQPSSRITPYQRFGGWFHAACLGWGLCLAAARVSQRPAAKA